jgi:tRNA(fMet)-specific endonuclease VapC
VAPSENTEEVSSPKYLLDTNSCIFLITRVRPLLFARVESCASDDVAIVAAELVIGFLKEGLDQPLEAFLKAVPVLPFGRLEANSYARVPFKRGKLDRLIAAHALALDAILVTANARDFTDVPGLKVEDWTI